MLIPMPEDFGYELGCAALGETLGDDDGCEAARAMGASIVGTEEMLAIKAVLRRLSVGPWTPPAPRPTPDDELTHGRRRLMEAWGLPQVVVEWVLS